MDIRPNCIGIAAFAALNAASPAFSQALRDGPSVNDINLNEATQKPALIDERPPRFAQPLRDGPATAIHPRVAIQHVSFHGVSALPTNDLYTYASNIEGKLVGRAELQQFANRLTEEYLSEGFFLSKAIIDRQSFDGGQLKVQISEGFFSKVLINGSVDHVLDKYFAELKTEKPARLKTFLRSTSLVSSLPGYTLKKRKIVEDPAVKDGYILLLTIDERLFQSQLNLTNRGVREGEALRAFFSARRNSILKPGDRLSVGYVLKPAAPSELQYFLGGYSIPIGRSGLTGSLNGIVSNTAPTSALAGRNLDGKLRKATLSLGYPLILTDRKSLHLAALFDWITSKEYENDQPLYNDRLRLLRVNGFHRSNLGDLGRLSIFAQATGGFDVFNASDGEGAFASRPDANGQFFMVDGEVTYQNFITDEFSVKAGMIGQYSPDPLLYYEEFSLGGGLYGRAYDFGEILGDSGAAVYLESGLHGKGDGLIKRWELYSYVDAGAVWNNGAGLSVDGNALYSAGGGVRIILNENLRFEYEAAHPLSDAPYTLKDGSTRHRFQMVISP